MKEIKLNEIKYGDIIEIKSLEDYEEDGEITISAGNSDLGSCSFKEYEIAKAYRVDK